MAAPARPFRVLGVTAKLIPAVTSPLK